MFIIGEEVFASESSYADLLGGIKEIRTGDDRKIENEGGGYFLCFPRADLAVGCRAFEQTADL